ncbi:MAG: HAD family hydrolase [Lachnospiraceae bacterium]|nr:HAD family hydrolase [Lachnospiraceae bacterium]
MDNRAVIFLDRDGVINRRAPMHSYIYSWDRFELLPGVTEAIRICNEKGLPVIVVSNQRGIARGIFTKEQTDQLHERLNEELQKSGAHIDAFFVCPHGENECECRKPKPGLFVQAQEYLEAQGIRVKKSGSFMIGDSASDILAGKAYGIRTVFIGDDREAFEKTGAGHMSPDLLSAIRYIEERDR